MNRIKIVFYLLVFVTTFFSCTTTSKQQNHPTLQFDGLYFTEKKQSGDEGYRHYLRFYEDGKVVGSSSSGKPDDVIKWLKTGKEDLSSGEYLITGNQIAFDLNSGLGDVSYKGTISINQLALSIESKINGHKSAYEYKFQRINSTD